MIPQDHTARLCPELTDKFCDIWWELMLTALHFKNWPSPNNRERRDLKCSEVFLFLLCFSNFSNNLLLYHVPIVGKRQHL